MTMLLHGLLPGSVAIAQVELSAPMQPLFAAERACLKGAYARRWREFAAGRTCARRALARLGQPPVAIPASDDRTPLWPSGYIGCISHSREKCIAAVAAKSGAVAAIGVDIERSDAVSPDLAQEILDKEEQLWLSLQPPAWRTTALTALFSAKECIFKCQFPISHRMFGFEALTVTLALEDGWFAGRFNENVSPFRAGDYLGGKIALAEGHVVTAMTLPAIGSTSMVRTLGDFAREQCQQRHDTIAVTSP
ncbi:MAG: 4'-phosphopantetheinyl transferase superfamily protein [Alphaproteobacteria bacterium]|nr:4'-phosphopantetheinyl transferase superfamily protein [Alphaproteobacteria bacterium]MBU1552192.1 4'-phosphopantetheinyl transferase superfamily protein [Alphaproteobacteria bacterium]MBU2336898.1 4'-phosphopantetheinyl transferase superfamily protein [Alphaproteobacteria bacterium]MBU2389655.1 4'-phosphopantetheinyl transferase superfamily protein [Alphaproteobacteria bacterium]